MTKQQQSQAREMIRHALGLNYKDKPFRNHYCAVIGGADWQLIQTCVAEELMFSGEVVNEGQDQYFHVTEKGKLFAE